jgi:hypothetical protein
MDNIGDYIYLLIIAVAAISGLLKKKAKNAESHELPKQPRKKAFDFDEILRELIPEEIKPVPVAPSKPVVYQPIKKAATNENLSYETASDPSALRAKKHMSKLANDLNEIKPIEIQYSEPVYRGVNVSLETVEDARQAFIYSEIFNRKY